MTRVVHVSVWLIGCSLAIVAGVYVTPGALAPVSHENTSRWAVAHHLSLRPSGRTASLLQPSIRVSSSVLAARSASDTAFEGLAPTAAESVLRRSFGDVVDRRAAGPPRLRAGERALGFPSAYAMSLDFGNGKRGVIESLQPMAVAGKDGHRHALDLNLRRANGGFEPVAAFVPIKLGREVSKGGKLVDSGVSLTPVSPTGLADSGTGFTFGAGVFYSVGDIHDDSLHDTGLFAKPTSRGFEMFSVLFSRRSPRHLFFKVGVPRGAQLVRDAVGRLRVIRGSLTVALIPRPRTVDAEGKVVPTSMAVSGDSVEVSISQKVGTLRYPLLVDPEVQDAKFLPYLHPGWVSCDSEKCPLPPEGPERKEDKVDKIEFSEFSGYGELVTTGSAGPLLASEWGSYQYETQGASKIYELSVETLEHDYFTETETLLEAYSPHGEQENWGLLANNDETYRFPAAICAIKTTECLPGQGAEKNLVEFVKRVLAEGAGGFEDYLYNADVYIYQEQSPTVTFNTEEPKIKVQEPNGTVVERENILFPGSKGWLSPHSSTAFEITALDSGIGVSYAGVYGRPVSLIQEGDCKGVQCPEEYKGKFTYQTTTKNFHEPWQNGEPELEAFAEDAANSFTYLSLKVRIDGRPPESIKLANMPAGNEFGEGIYKIKAEATDGSEHEPSSGVASLKIGIDGAEAGEPMGSCPAGPCTASAEWTINGGQLSAGPHILTITATDNAGNVSNKPFVIFVHHTSPNALGPGSFDPQSGNFSLGSSDVSMGPGLTLNRAYSSRNVSDGVESGLGPQWSISLGGSEALGELADGSMVLTSASSGETVFERNSKGEFVSPKGDTNVTLSSEENAQKIPVAYYLKDQAKGSSTKFSRPEGYLQTSPQYYGELGWQQPGSGQLNMPMGVATDSKGDTWIADTQNDRVVEFNPQGEYETEFSYQGSTNGALAEPRGIAVDPKGDLWVADTANNRIEEFNEKGEFLRIGGTEGFGKLKSPQGIIATSSGNVWVTDTSDNRLVEFNERAEYQREASKTIGSHQLSEPVGIAADSSGDVWAADTKNHRIVEFNANGEGLKEYGSQGTGNGEFETPTGLAIDSENNVYISDYAENRVQELNSKGEYLTTFGSTGAGPTQLRNPYMVAIDQRGELVVADSENSRVDRWAHTVWSPSASEGPVAVSKISFVYKAVRSSVGTVVEPSEVIAPHAASLSCSPIKTGCQALILKYATTTKATEGEWGEYEGRLTEVLFAGYNPATKAMQELVVAQYAYDNIGRLRAEWDPRIKPALKIVYGYDAEGHVTAVSASGQEPWLIHYGTTPVDGSMGRVLSVIRPPATSEIGDWSAPENATRPEISTTTPKVGSAISITTNGGWTNTPLTYSYQWEACVTGVDRHRCSDISGADNETYYPTSADQGKKLRVTVTAYDAGGSNSASSAITSEVESGTPYNPAPEPPNVGSNAVTTVEYGLPTSGSGLPNLSTAEVERWGEKEVPLEGTAMFPPARPMGWPAKEYIGANISYFNAQGRTVNTSNPAGGISTTEYNEHGDTVRSLSAVNRATALAEGAKSAEAAAKLDVRSTYSEAGDELLETLGPEHKIKLPGGSEVQAREKIKYYYDEGSPEGKEYRLLTRTVESAMVTGKEEDSRTTRTYYSGQNGLGWKLRKPTSVVVDPAGLDLVHTTVYNETTGAVVETKAPGGTAESVNPPTFSFSIGSEGSGPGQFNHPESDAFDASGNLWVVDKVNDRIEKFSSTGTFLAAYGSKGSGNLQFSEPWGIAISATTGNIFVSDQGNSRIEVLNSKGEYQRSFGTSGIGNGQFKGPSGVSVDSKGYVWVSDEGNNRVEQFSETGEYKGQLGSSGTGEGQLKAPVDIAISEGELYVADSGNNRVEEFSLSREYLGVIGNTGKGAGQFTEPRGIAANPTNGDLYITDFNEERVQEFSPAGKFLTQWGTWSKSHEVANPVGIAINSTGKLYITDRYAGKVTAWTLPETGGAQLNYASTFGSSGSGEGQFSKPYSATIDGEGNLWITDHGNNRIEEFTTAGVFKARYGSTGTGNVNFKGPWGIAINKSTGNIYIADSENNRIQEISSAGTYITSFGTGGSGMLELPKGIAIDSSGNVWVADCGHNRVVEFSASGTYMAAYGSYGSGEKQFKGPAGIVYDAGYLYVTDVGDDRVEELSTSGAYVRSFGLEGNDTGEFYGPFGITADAAGNLYVVDQGNDRVEEFSATGGFQASFATKGSGEAELNEPTGVTISSAGDMYVVDTANNRVEHWMPADRAAHDTKMVYYTAKEEAEVATCRNHPEWTGLVCQTQPAGQPVDSSAPPLPVTTVLTYNMWAEPETSEEAFGSTIRTKKLTYDEGGRPLTSSETSTVDTSLPEVTDTYSETTGQLVQQTTKVGEETQTVVSVYDKLGRLVSYTDADKGKTSYEYEPSGDGRLTSVTDARGYETYAYDPTTGLLTKLVDSAAKAFTASYDVEGDMIEETYPNGMKAAYTYDPTGDTTGVEYVKSTHCAEKCQLFNEIIIPSVHGETISRKNTLANDTYTYDASGRLTQTTEEPAGKGCATRVYAYDEESNRKSLTTRGPGLEGKCSTEGGTTETHIYDAGNRLADPEVAYDQLGNTTKLPAADAGGHELITEYYVDGQVQRQAQNGQTNTYYLDPSGRIRKNQAEGTIKLVTINHYAGPGEALTWKCEEEPTKKECEEEKPTKWTRLIPGIDGTLCATQTNSEAPVLQLHDLEGNVVATAADSETETKLLSTYNSTEFGVQVNGPPPTKYSWLGATGVSSELSSGALVAGTVAYQPQLARQLQTQPVTPPGAAINGGTAEVVPYAAQGSGWSIDANNATGAQDTHEHELEEQETEEREAQEKACAIASECVVPESNAPEGEETEEEEFGELEGGEGDPIGLASYNTVLRIIKFLKTHANRVTLLSEIAKYLPGTIMNVIGSTGPAIAATYRSYAASLEHNCTAYEHSAPWSACLLQYEQFKVKIGPITWGLLYYVSAEFCWRPVGDQSGMYDCPHGPRNGPWVKFKG